MTDRMHLPVSKIVITIVLIIAVVASVLVIIGGGLIAWSIGGIFVGLIMAQRLG